MGYNGKNLDGEERWDGVRDIHINKFELGTDFTSIIESFNCGTNAFAKKFVLFLFNNLVFDFNDYFQFLILFYAKKINWYNGNKVIILKWEKDFFLKNVIKLHFELLFF